MTKLASYPQTCCSTSREHDIVLLPNGIWQMEDALHTVDDKLLPRVIIDGTEWCAIWVRQGEDRGALYCSVLLCPGRCSCCWTQLDVEHDEQLSRARSNPRGHNLSYPATLKLRAAEVGANDNGQSVQPRCESLSWSRSLGAFRKLY